MRNTYRYSTLAFYTICKYQGSGKTSVANEIVSRGLGNRSWARLSQDVLKNREKVVKESNKMLSCGKSIVIDRTNFNSDQRSHFLAMANDRGLPAFGVILDIPVAVSRPISEAFWLRS